MTEVSSDIFYRTTATWQRVSHTQWDAWCRSQVKPDNLRYFLDGQQPHRMGCVGYVRRRLGIRMLCIGGECISSFPLTSKQIRDFYGNVAELGYDIVEMNLDSEYSPEYEVGLRLAGWLRPVGLFSTTLSKEIDLNQPLRCDKSWQRNLRQCDNYGLHFTMLSQPKEDDIKAYMHLHSGMVQRKRFNDFLTAASLTELLRDNSHFRLCTVSHESGIVAGMVIYKEDGKRAISLYSATNERGRELSASYFLYREVFLNLHTEHQVQTFDMGRLAPSRHAKNSVFLFKNGVEGRLVQYNGEWLWCRRPWMPLLLYLLKKHVWKRVQV